MVPLFKKACVEKSGNYRPVSLMFVVEMFLEHILRDKIYMQWTRGDYV